MLSPWRVFEICPLLEYYATFSGNFYDVSGQLIRSIFKGQEFHCRLRNIPEECSFHLLRGGSVNSGKCVVIPVRRFSPGVSYTGMRRKTTFRLTTDRIYDGGPIGL
jgi:hypothetical protein